MRLHFSRRIRWYVCGFITSCAPLWILEGVTWSTRSIPATTPLRPRYATRHLSDATLFVSHGSSRSGYNSAKHRTDQGPYPSLCYTCFDPALIHTENQALQDLIAEMFQSPCRSLYPCTSLAFTRAEFFFAYNPTKHWFFEVSLPVQKLKQGTTWISRGILQYRDLDQRVVSHVKDILDAFSLNGKFGCQERRGMCDSALYTGYTTSFFCIGPFDFIDLTARMGVWIPTGKRSPCAWPDEQFFGFEGHWGVPLSVCGSVSIFQWLVAHGHVGVMPLARRCEVSRTAPCDSTHCAMLRSVCATVDEHAGTVVTAGIGATADHFFQGFILDLDYRVDHQTHRTHTLTDAHGSPLEYDNAPFLLPWTRHTVAAGISYDFSCQRSPSAPIVGVYGIATIGGRRIYRTSVNTLFLGVQCLWTF